MSLTNFRSRFAAIALAAAGCALSAAPAACQAPPGEGELSASERFEAGYGVMLTRLPIPHRASGYQHLDTQVVGSRTALNKLLDGARDRDFVDALSAARIDFDRSALLLVRHTEGSGSVRVWVETPRVDGELLIVKVSQQAPELLTADMAYYCFAYVVPRRLASHVAVVGSRTPAKEVFDDDGRRRIERSHNRVIELNLEAAR
ncbi:hypothetical protein [Botrimarina sp.]|uniref:hypothetical protein n=1 Tax=Botrimarina sp. TaxID=2795802 RepID=UPI0032EE507E